MNLEQLKFYIKCLNPDDRKAFLTSQSIANIFRSYAEKGNLEALRTLVSLMQTNAQIAAMIHANNEETFIRAVRNNHLEVVKYIIELTPVEQQPDLIHAQNDMAFSIAKENADKTIFDFLEALAEEFDSTKTIANILKSLKKKEPTVLTPAIAQNLEMIVKRCNDYYSVQALYGNAALNRMMLLDPEIAKLLTPEVISYLFTHESSSQTRIKRDSTAGGVALRDAIYFGFKEGLCAIKLMPPNVEWYSLAAYQKQHEDYQNNTLRIVQNIYQAAGLKERCLEEVESDESFYAMDLMQQFQRIVATINKVKSAGESEKLLFVPRYSADSMRKQAMSGFDQLCYLINMPIEDNNVIKNVTLDNLCDSFLKNPNVVLNGTVTHLFYDRAHILAALEQDTLIKIGNNTYTFQDIFKKMIEKITSSPDAYPDATKEQFYIRFSLVIMDLNERFSDIFNSKEMQLQFEEKKAKPMAAPQRRPAAFLHKETAAGLTLTVTEKKYAAMASAVGAFKKPAEAPAAGIVTYWKEKFRLS